MSNDFKLPLFMTYNGIGVIKDTQWTLSDGAGNDCNLNSMTTKYFELLDISRNLLHSKTPFGVNISDNASISMLSDFAVNNPPSLINSDYNYSYYTESRPAVVITNNSHNLSSDDVGMPYPIIHMYRKNVQNQQIPGRASINISKWEDAQKTYNGVTYDLARTQIDIGLAHNTIEDINVLSIRSDGRVGVNNSNPDYNLHVTGNFHADDISTEAISLQGTSLHILSQPYTGLKVVSPSGIGSYAGYGIWDDLIFMYDGETDLGLYNADSEAWYIKAIKNNSISLYYNGLEKLSTKSDGIQITDNALYVGAHPYSSALLQFGSGTGDSADSAWGYANIQTRQQTYATGETGTELLLFGGYSKTNKDRIRIRSSAIAFDTYPNDLTNPPTFAETSNENIRMFINSVGNVGIGTLDVAYKLQVEGNCAIRNPVIENGSYAHTTAALTVTNQTEANTTAEPVLNICRQGVSSSVSGDSVYGSRLTLALSRYESTGFESKTKADFILAKNAYEDTNVMSLFGDQRVHIDGNLGVGTHSPSTKVDVWGKARIFETTGTKIPAGIGTKASETATIGSLTIEHNDSGGASSILFPSKVGSGTDYGYIMYVDNVSSGTFRDWNYFNFDSSGDRNSALIIGVESTKSAPNASGTGDTIIIAGKAGTVIDTPYLYLANGNLGIGTNEATSHIHVYNDTPSIIAQITNNENEGKVGCMNGTHFCGIILNGSSHATDASVGTLKNEAGELRLQSSANSGLKINTDGDVFFDGNVGIGVTMTGNALEVSGDTLFDGGITIDVGRGNIFIENNTNDDVSGEPGITIRSSATNTNGPILSVRSNNENSKLWIGGNITSIGNNKFCAGFSGGVGDEETIANYGLVINTSGHLGIGTTEPLHEIDVHGDIKLSDALHFNNIDLSNVTNTGSNVLKINNTTTDGYSGISIKGKSVLIAHNNDSHFGLYDNTNAKWVLKASKTTTPKTELFYDGSSKFETKADGVSVTGTIYADSLYVKGYQAQWTLAGGGMVTFKSNRVKWNASVKATPLQNSINSNGYINIDSYTSGNIKRYLPDVAVFENIACNDDGIPIGNNEALYYNINSLTSSSSDISKFVIVNPTNTGWTLNSDYVLICINYSHGTNNTLKWLPGNVNIPAGSEYDSIKAKMTFYKGQFNIYDPDTGVTTTTGTGTVFGNLNVWANNASVGNGTGTNVVASFLNTDQTSGIGIAYDGIIATGTGTNQNINIYAKGATGTVIIGTNTNERVYVTGTGSVGIGISEPSYALDVDGNIKTSSNLYFADAYFSDVSSGSYGSIQINSNKNTYFGYSIQGDILFAYNDTNSEYGIYDDLNNQWGLKGITNGSISLYNQGNERLKTTTDGVQVVGNVVSIGTSANSSSILHLGSGEINNNWGFSVIESRKYDTTNNSSELLIFKGYKEDKDRIRLRAGRIVFDTYNVGLASTPDDTTRRNENIRMVIDASGNVGIGSTNPAYELDVEGDISFSGTLQNGTVPYDRLSNLPDWITSNDEYIQEVDSHSFKVENNTLILCNVPWSYISDVPPAPEQVVSSVNEDQFSITSGSLSLTSVSWSLLGTGTVTASTNFIVSGAFEVSGTHNAKIGGNLTVDGNIIGSIAGQLYNETITNIVTATVINRVGTWVGVNTSTDYSTKYHINNKGYLSITSFNVNESSTNDTAVTFDVPAKKSHMYINHRAWNDCGYFDVYGHYINDNTSDNWLWLCRINNYNPKTIISNDEKEHSGVTISEIGGVDRFDKIRINQVKGNITILGVGWSERKNGITNGGWSGFLHYDNLIGSYAQIGNTVDVGSSSTFSHSDGVLTLTNQIGTGTLLNDPKPLLHLCRQGSTTIHGARASFYLSRYEDNGINSRTRFDLNLAHDDYDADENVMTILSSGNVGIGITNPLAKLHVNGNMQCDGDMILGGASRTVGTKSGYDFSLQAGGSTSITIKSGGNVGIGTTDPLSKLHVDGNMRCDGDMILGGTSRIVGTQSGYDFSLQAGGNTKITIKSGGNVGIGNADPNAPLCVGDSTLSGSDGSIVIEKHGTGTSARSVKLGYDDTNNDFIIGKFDGSTHTRQFIMDYNAPDKSVEIFSGGNVGIRPTVTNSYSFPHSDAILTLTHQTPTNASTLNDPMPILHLCRQGFTNTDDDTVFNYGARASFYLSRYENEGHNSRTRLDLNLAHNSYTSTAANSSNVMTFLSGGNVGIGTTNPLAKLHVA
eukprot:534574-Hanusia_phi.AAC.1